MDNTEKSQSLRDPSEEEHTDFIRLCKIKGNVSPWSVDELWQAYVSGYREIYDTYRKWKNSKNPPAGLDAHDENAGYGGLKIAILEDLSTKGLEKTRMHIKKFEAAIEKKSSSLALIGINTALGELPVKTPTQKSEIGR